MKDINLFKSQPLNTKVLLATAAIYAFVLPVIEIFQAAYIMGQSADMARVVLYQLMVYTSPNPTPSSSKIFVRVNGVAGGLYGWPLAFVSR